MSAGDKPLRSSFLVAITPERDYARFVKIRQEDVMSESEMISRRRVFSVLGLAAAAGFAAPAAVMTATDAEARVGNPGSAVSVAGANRRDRRQDRRTKKKK
jgi:hypothetical protein